MHRPYVHARARPRRARAIRGQPRPWAPPLRQSLTRTRAEPVTALRRSVAGRKGRAQREWLRAPQPSPNSRAPRAGPAHGPRKPQSPGCNATAELAGVGRGLRVLGRAALAGWGRCLRSQGSDYPPRRGQEKPQRSLCPRPSPSACLGAPPRGLPTASSRSGRLQLLDARAPPASPKGLS